MYIKARTAIRVRAFTFFSHSLGAFAAFHAANRALRGCALSRSGPAYGGTKPLQSLARAKAFGFRLGSFAEQNSRGFPPLCGFGFAEFARSANSWVLLVGVWSFAPNSENQNAERFGSASVPFLSCKFFAMQKTYETITTGVRDAHTRLKPGCIYRTYQAFSPRRADAACF
jgi:hypothetical protein